MSAGGAVSEAEVEAASDVIWSMITYGTTDSVKIARAALEAAAKVRKGE